MTTMEGGMVVCHDEELADRLKILRAHGWLRNVDESEFSMIGAAPCRFLVAPSEAIRATVITEYVAVTEATL